MDHILVQGSKKLAWASFTYEHVVQNTHTQTWCHTSGETVIWPARATAGAARKVLEASGRPELFCHDGDPVHRPTTKREKTTRARAWVWNARAHIILSLLASHARVLEVFLFKAHDAASPMAGMLILPSR